MRDNSHGTSAASGTAHPRIYPQAVDNIDTGGLAEKSARPNLPGLLGAMKRRHAGERSALRARQRLEARAMHRRVKAGRA